MKVKVENMGIGDWLPLPDEHQTAVMVEKAVRDGVGVVLQHMKKYKKASVVDGELYIGYDDNKTLVMEVDQLFRDLPSIISMVTKEQKKMQEMHLKMIKQAL